MIRINLANGGHQFRGAGENPRRVRYFRRLLGSYGHQRGIGQRVGDPSILQTSQPFGAGLLRPRWLRRLSTLPKPTQALILCMGSAFAGGFGLGAIWGFSHITWALVLLQGAGL